jgi:hypothetical protein
MEMDGGGPPQRLGRRRGSSNELSLLELGTIYVGSFEEFFGILGRYVVVVWLPLVNHGNAYSQYSTTPQRLAVFIVNDQKHGPFIEAIPSSLCCAWRYHPTFLLRHRRMAAAPYYERCNVSGPVRMACWP